MCLDFCDLDEKDVQISGTRFTQALIADPAKAAALLPIGQTRLRLLTTAWNSCRMPDPSAIWSESTSHPLPALSYSSFDQTVAVLYLCWKSKYQQLPAYSISFRGYNYDEVFAPSALSLMAMPGCHCSFRPFLDRISVAWLFGLLSGHQPQQLMARLGSPFRP